MARKIRSPIDNRTNRLALKPRRKPYGWTPIARGVRVAYRRNKRGPGTWVIAVADGKGGEWQARVGPADDYEDAIPQETVDPGQPFNPDEVLNFWQATERGRVMARGQTSESSRPVTWAQALDNYERDLIARDGDPINASRVRFHLSGTTLLSKPVALLTATELKRWRNDLIEAIKPATVARILASARASLNHAADHDPGRISNRNAWRVGLSGLAGTYTSVNRVISDADVLRLKAAAYALDESFGTFIHVAAETGARASQIARLLVADLQLGPAPKLLMPSSRKGRKRQIRRVPVPITLALATRLAAVASDRSPDDALLLRGDGSPWEPKKQNHLQIPFATIAKQCGINETSYCLRHAAIVRSLLAGVPAELVASMCDTSLRMLSLTYARYITHFGDQIARRGLLDEAAQPPGNVVPLPGRR